MTSVNELYGRLIDALEVDDLSIPTACVKIYQEGEDVPTPVSDCEPRGLTLTSCQSARQASFGDVSSPAGR